MINISDIDPEYFMINDFKGCEDGSILFNLCYSDENGGPHIAFNNIGCIFRKSGIYSYLIFVKNNKTKDMINNYVKIIDQTGDEIASWIIELEDNLVKFKADIMKFKFRTDDNLVYNKKINIPVCAMSLSSVIKRKIFYYPTFRLQRCFYERESL